MKKILLFFAFFIGVLQLQTYECLALENNERVLAQASDHYWYPGTVKKIQDSVVSIAFDNGKTADIDEKLVKTLDWAAGTKLECQWPYDSKFYPGTVIDIAGEKIRIVYEDGDKANLSIAKCRQKQSSKNKNP